MEEDKKNSLIRALEDMTDDEMESPNDSDAIDNIRENESQPITSENVDDYIIKKSANLIDVLHFKTAQIAHNMVDSPEMITSLSQIANALNSSLKLILDYKKDSEKVQLQKIKLSNDIMKSDEKSSGNKDNKKSPRGIILTRKEMIEAMDKGKLQKMMRDAEDPIEIKSE